jgi:hypothetical protein
MHLEFSIFFQHAWHGRACCSTPNRTVEQTKHKDDDTPALLKTTSGQRLCATARKTNAATYATPR